MATSALAWTVTKGPDKEEQRRVIWETVDVPDVRKIPDMIEALKTAYAQVPDAYKDTAEILYDGDHSYVFLSVAYKRFETDDENRARTQFNNYCDKENEARERAELYRLINKYGVPENKE